MRKKMRPKKDKKVFRCTAAKSKKININPTVFRGGNMHYALGKYQTDKGFENQVFLEQNYPSNYVQAVNSILKALGLDVTGGATSSEGSVSAEQYAKLMEKYNAALLGSGPKRPKHQR